jgi:hypothetical protein
MGQDHSTCTPHLVVLITTGSRSVFRRKCNTGTSLRSHKRELPHHTSVTSSCCLKTHVEALPSYESPILFGNNALLMHPQALFHSSRSHEEPCGQRIGSPSECDGKQFRLFQRILLPFPGERAFPARPDSYQVCRMVRHVRIPFHEKRPLSALRVACAIRVTPSLKIG